MQYLLTESEFKELTERKNNQIKMEKDELQKLCTTIATTMPIKFWGRDEAQPWGCPEDVSVSKHQRIEYCDCCPVIEICPNQFKEWSK